MELFFFNLVITVGDGRNNFFNPYFSFLIDVREVLGNIINGQLHKPVGISMFH